MNRASDRSADSSERIPWIEVAEGADVSGAAPLASWPYSSRSPSTARALFGIRIRPLSFEQRKDFKWGFSAANARQEAVERQQQFVADLRFRSPLDFRSPTNEPTLALHGFHDPAEQGLILCLLGAVNGRDAAEAYALAVDLWRFLTATFPYDYELTPLCTRTDYLNDTGMGLLDKIEGQNEIVELRRFEMRLTTHRGPGFLLGSWQSAGGSDEQVWRALASANQPTLLSVRIQPTTISAPERAKIDALMNISPAGEESPAELVAQYCRLGAALYEERKGSWRSPYMMQLHLASLGGVPGYLTRALASAMTYHRDDVSDQSGYQVAIPHETQDVTRWRQALTQVTFANASPASTNQFMYRLSLLAGLDETLAAFRWPYPPQPGLPGVRFI